MEVGDQFVGIDLGARRIGLATGNRETRIARPYKTVAPAELKAAITALEPIAGLVIGLPRGLDGQSTAQTLAVRHWADDLLGDRQEPVIWQDEAGTSSVAEAELKASGKPFDKALIDAHAAAIILQDYLDSL